jgi:ferredoxin
MAVRAVAHGQKAALAVDCYVRTGQALTGNQNFNCRVRTFLPSEQKRLLQYASAKGRVFHHVDCKKEYSEEEARSEASRCFDCSCKSAANCSLRVYASEYRAEQKFREPADRRELFTYPGDDSINFEPAKCIRCGRCVRLSGDIANEPGLAFAGKGDEMTVVPALGESLARALTISAQKCVEACPTGALYFNDSISRQIESEQEKNEA